MEKITVHQNRVLSEKICEFAFCNDPDTLEGFRKRVIHEFQQINEATGPDALATFDVLEMPVMTVKKRVLRRYANRVTQHLQKKDRCKP